MTWLEELLSDIEKYGVDSSKVQEKVQEKYKEYVSNGNYYNLKMLYDITGIKPSLSEEDCLRGAEVWIEKGSLSHLYLFCKTVYNILGMD